MCSTLGFLADNGFFCPKMCSGPFGFVCIHEVFHGT
ncbi:MAG: hypothetical protein A4E65_00971 [Syntrophorhabdus sp. PtaU1.Bin153]|nr:MAG: hypothetical protein A4E65_00971 [Syntrophorhabdus sp. PtaU1.Bin153]